MTLTPHQLLVLWSRKSRAIPLLPLWAVPSVQCLSACTVQLNLQSPYWPYGLYRASVPVQYSYTSNPPMACTVQLYLYSPYGPYSLYSTAIPLLPLCAILPVHRLSACTVQLYLYSPYGPYGLYRTSVPVQYSYTSNPTTDRTACTEPQCLFNGALYLHLLPHHIRGFSSIRNLLSRNGVVTRIHLLLHLMNRLCSKATPINTVHKKSKDNFFSAPDR